jgi:hypothetical protein
MLALIFNHLRSLTPSSSESRVNIIDGNPSNFAVVYDQGLGDIQLVNTIPEPSTALLLAVGMWAISAKRWAWSEPHTSPLV